MLCDNNCHKLITIVTMLLNHGVKKLVICMLMGLSVITMVTLKQLYRGVVMRSCQELLKLRGSDKCFWTHFPNGNLLYDLACLILMNKAMLWGPKYGWPGVCHLGECWVNRNICFSCSHFKKYMLTSILIIVIVHTRHMWQLGHPSMTNICKYLYFGGWISVLKSNQWSTVETWHLLHNVA